MHLVYMLALNQEYNDKGICFAEPPRFFLNIKNPSNLYRFYLIFEEFLLVFEIINF